MNRKRLLVMVLGGLGLGLMLFLNSARPVEADPLQIISGSCWFTLSVGPLSSD